jgi:hypothetical protein
VEPKILRRSVDHSFHRPNCLVARYDQRFSVALVAARVFVCTTEGENMRIALNVVGAVLVFFGGVWFLQGVNVLPGSFMSGQMRWAVRGGIAAIAGIALLLWANRKRQGS